MKIRRIFLITLLFLCFSISNSLAGEALTLASGAGYKKLVTELSKVFTDKTGIEVRQIFGNMGQVIAQAEQSGQVDCVIGDKRFLDGATLSFGEEYLIGQGRLVAAAPKGSAVTRLEAMANPEIKRIAMPDPKKAIYGRSAAEYLAKSGMKDKVEGKLLVVGTVPQVSAYVVSGEVDLGFINMTDALAIKDKVGRLIEVDQALYEPIRIVAKTLKSAPDAAAAGKFGEFLQSEEAGKIVAKHGM